MDKNWKLLINSPTLEALSPEQCTLMMRSLPELQKPVWHSEDRANVWERNGIKIDTKLKVYKAVILPTLLYACETWTVYQHHAKRQPFPLKLIKKVLKIKWQDKIPDTEVLKESSDAKHVYRLKASTAKMNWSCYQNA